MLSVANKVANKWVSRKCTCKIDMANKVAKRWAPQGCTPLIEITKKMANVCENLEGIFSR